MVCVKHLGPQSSVSCDVIDSWVPGIDILLSFVLLEIILIQFRRSTKLLGSYTTHLLIPGLQYVGSQHLGFPLIPVALGLQSSFKPRHGTKRHGAGVVLEQYLSGGMEDAQHCDLPPTP